MEAEHSTLVDARYGIEYRAVEGSDRPGWRAQWRPLRALKRFMTFSYITRSEHFLSRGEALEFIRRNAAAIGTGEV